ncbi:RNA-binding domain-containing protein [Coccomyxa subellipsoidea C-169]|uniref:RNA-binding domain-containing protein n=1 Tax=Coccomyxa subellipsoidea (strain C-169) TaxID=574566 RepID=I0YLI7_COCSC|nr:RNA-binding domain-containing protein [Coccomyxa subellipsoidea C-169]EIE19256.1 RNA-binding domain-containing protein [Coccomyxa subellipsoidea C-169]|eukprot:XP_005643800.1 RNA-binding domain-containing protein [Coccomyxa subellipsoidea C-169]
MSEQPVHRFSQPPSKVLHIRNLPYETTEEELRELCSNFGPIVQTKLNVGTNKNQAFVEFPDMNMAIQMVSYFANAADPAKVRGKTVYLQYSTRQEIVNSTRSAEQGGNVLLVSLENLAPDMNVTLDTLHLVFSAFGLVQKIATFEKGQGFQALVQYADAETAEQVRLALDGRHIPKHLLNDTPNPPSLKITYSQHTDLNVKFQSHRSRDYTNLYLPAAPAGGDPNLALGIQAPISGNPLEGNVLLCQIENQAYPVNVDALNTVFSPYGFVQKIAIFDKNGQSQALIQYPDPLSATNAKSALEGHAIYDGGYNRLKISYSVHRNLNVKANNDRSCDYTLQPGAPQAATPDHSYQQVPPSPPASPLAPVFVSVLCQHTRTRRCLPDRTLLTHPALTTSPQVGALLKSVISECHSAFCILHCLFTFLVMRNVLFNTELQMDNSRNC